MKFSHLFLVIALWASYAHSANLPYHRVEELDRRKGYTRPPEPRDNRQIQQLEQQELDASGEPITRQELEEILDRKLKEAQQKPSPDAPKPAAAQKPAEDPQKEKDNPAFGKVGGIGAVGGIAPVGVANDELPSEP